MEVHEKFSILITTRNRIEQLKITLGSLNPLFQAGIKVIICDDGSKDNTSFWLRKNYPQVKLIVNDVSQGYISNRNKLLAMVETPYAISLDDDASIISQDPLVHIARHFESNPQCGLIALRIFWGLSSPKNTISSDTPHRVKSFVGCAHTWRMKAWRSIPDYPCWYKFYGEEDFASFHLFKRNWEVHYLPEVLVHHRADIKARKKEKDYIPRLSSSLKAGWNNYFIFYPSNLIPRHFFYSIWMQLRIKIFRGDFKALLALMLALKDTLKNIPQLKRNRSSLSKEEFRAFKQLPDTQFYWKD
jgi:glycosyltransferase involved in cell wall biosynthesis